MKKRVMQSVEREKTAAEKIKLATCRCGHVNTLHAGAIYDCGFPGCTCCEFGERLAGEPRDEKSAFQEVKETMGKSIV